MQINSLMTVLWPAMEGRVGEGYMNSCVMSDAAGRRGRELVHYSLFVFGSKTSVSATACCITICDRLMMRILTVRHTGCAVGQVIMHS